MNLEEIKSITLSLLKKETDPDSENKATYSKKVTAKFTPPSDFPRTEEMFEVLLKNMHEDLLKNITGDPDSLGIWIEMDSITIDNAISLQTLDDIQKYSKEDINPIWEFFKMTYVHNNTNGESGPYILPVEDDR